MTDAAELQQIICGEIKDSRKTMDVLKKEILPPVIKYLNERTLRREFLLFNNDQIPTNQRNLTDVRTRMGASV